MNIYLKDYLQYFSHKRLVRTAAYVRVSHEEQKKHGFSVEAQKKGLQKYANENGYLIVDWYIDEGFSARKKSKTRKELTRLLEDAKQKKFEMIIFKCIDRWFRNIAEYHKTQDILEDNKIDWECSEEEYDTTTREGRLKLNLYLMLAQDEADRGSERINYVFEDKIKRKEAITGSTPFGFKNQKIDGKIRVVKDEEVSHIVDDIFYYYELTHNKRKTLFHIQDKYNISFSSSSFRRIFTNTLYYGHYKGIDNYVWNGSYLSKEKFDYIQKINSKSIKFPPTANDYIFTGLLKCDKCGGTLSSCVSKHKDKSYIYYRCRKAYDLNQCSSRKMISEDKLEKYLLKELDNKIKDYKAFFSVKESKGTPKPKISASEIKKEMERLNKMYRKNRISEDEYDKDFEKLEKELLKVKNSMPIKKDFSVINEFLKNDWITIYETLNKNEKRMLFRSIIDFINCNADTKKFDITFL